MRILQTTLCISLILLCAATATAKIVFSADSKIYVMNDNGRSITQINDNPYLEFRPVWSPNGRHIAFLRDITPNDGSGNLDIYIMNADGTNAKQLVDQKGSIWEIRISPNGKKLLYITAYVGINILDIDTRNSETILPNHHGYHADWSPDGTQIVFINDDHDIIEKNLWFVDANGENMRQWTHPDPDKGEIHRFLPRWSPDGKQMLYSEMDIDVERIEREDGGFSLRIWAGGTFRVIIQNIDDGNTRTLKIPENWYPSSLAWMDGQQAVLFSAYEYERDHRRPVEIKIYKYDLATDEITFLTEGYHPHWNGGKLPISPIGKQSVRWAELKRAYTE